MTLELLFTICLKLCVFIVLIMYVFFSFFLYLRVRVLSLSLDLKNAMPMKFITLIHFFVSCIGAFVLTLLLLL